MTDKLDRDNEHGEIESLLGAYALHATDPDEAERVEVHLRTCPRCRAEVDGLYEMAAAMGNSVEPVSAALWDRIATGIAGVHDGDPDADNSPDPSLLWFPPDAGDGRDSHAEGAAPVIDLTQPRQRRQRSWRRAGAVLAAAAAVVIGLLSVTLAQSDHHVNQLQTALSSKGDSVGVATALANPAHQIVRMRSVHGAQLAEFVVVPGGHGYMTTSTMPALPKDETYQLWAVIDGQPISLGLLGNQVRSAAFTVGGAASPSQLQITVEPSGGVVAPDRAPVATGTT
jgi:anti-sigma-K factor RskA